MPSLSFASWNVEHFEGDNARVADCVEFIRESDPDVFALYELKGEDVFFELVDRMPDHHVFITEYPGDMNILVGCRDGTTAFPTQRNERSRAGVNTLERGCGRGGGGDHGVAGPPRYARRYRGRFGSWSSHAPPRPRTSPR